MTYRPFFWNSGLWSPWKSKLTIRSASDQTLTEARLMAEQLPKETYLGRQSEKPANKEQHANKKQKLDKHLNDKENTGKDKVKDQWYKIKGAGPSGCS